MFSGVAGKSRTYASERKRLKCEAMLGLEELGLPYIVYTPLVAIGAFAAFSVANTVFKLATTGSLAKKQTTATTIWPEMESALREKQIRSLTPFEAKSLVNNKGYVLIDVRMPSDFLKRHPRGAVNVPLFTTSKSETPADVLKAGLLATMSIVATKENPFFVDMVRAEVKADTVGIVVVDDSKLGTLNRTYANNKATRCRAIVAIFCLLTDAPDITIPISHSDGGVEALYNDGFPSEPRPGV